jgi:hypothetical protein
LVEESTKLQDLTSELANLDHAQYTNKMWIFGFKEEISQMQVGQVVIGRLIPVDKI